MQKAVAENSLSVDNYRDNICNIFIKLLGFNNKDTYRYDLITMNYGT